MHHSSQPVILGGLREADPALGEQRRAAAQEVPVQLVVGVDHPDDLSPLVGELAQRVVQRTGLVARPVLQVRELDPVPRAPPLDRPPQALVVGVVVDEDDLVVRVLKAHQRAERVDDHVRRLVVRWDVQADEREIAGGGQLRRGGGRDLPQPGLRADGVADLPEVGAGEDCGENLEAPQQQPADGARHPQVAGEGPVQDVGQVDDEQEDARRPAQVAAGVPAAGHGKPDQAPGNQAGHGGDRIVLGHPEQPQRNRHDRGQHRCARQREREPAGGGPRAGRPVPRLGADEQRGRAQRRGQDPGQHERSEHEPPPGISQRLTAI
jgi:hypothetical protein